MDNKDAADHINIAVKPGEYVGAFPIRQDITVLPHDDANKIKLGWTIEESTGPFYLPSDDNSCYETEQADKFLGSNGTRVNAPDRGTFAWDVVPQLEFLWGQPWNNLALNYVMGLRPSSIRVSTGLLTADAVTWRVTVILEKDNRTIRSIDQECSVGAIGAECGQDLELKLQQQKTGKKIPQFDASLGFVNQDALKDIVFALGADGKPSKRKTRRHSACKNQS